MPIYRVRTRDGAERVVQALRARIAGGRLRLENRAGGLWQPALEVPLEDLEWYQRRVNEINGNWAWVTERPGLPATGPPGA